MSSLTLLTAAVVVMGLWCWVPSGADDFFNPRFRYCNRSAVPYVDLSTPQRIEGRWYMSHGSISPGTTYRYNGIVHDFKLSVPLARDAIGEENRNFLVTTITATLPTSTRCNVLYNLRQIIGNAFTKSYFVFFETLDAVGQIYFFNTYLIATDYNSTAVVLTEAFINGDRNTSASRIVVYVKDPAISPDPEVVDAALNGYCTGNFLNLSSDYYYHIPNDSNLTCFPKPSLTT